VTSSSVACVERLEFPNILRRYSVNKNEPLRTLARIAITMRLFRLLLFALKFGCTVAFFV
jgi:hypothetical protein